MRGFGFAGLVAAGMLALSSQASAAIMTASLWGDFDDGEPHGGWLINFADDTSLVQATSVHHDC